MVDFSTFPTIPLPPERPGGLVPSTRPAATQATAPAPTATPVPGGQPGPIAPAVNASPQVFRTDTTLGNLAQRALDYGSEAYAASRPVVGDALNAAMAAIAGAGRHQFPAQIPPADPTVSAQLKALQAPNAQAPITFQQAIQSLNPADKDYADKVAGFAQHYFGDTAAQPHPITGQIETAEDRFVRNMSGATNRELMLFAQMLPARGAADQVVSEQLAQAQSAYRKAILHKVDPAIAAEAYRKELGLIVPRLNPAATLDTINTGQLPQGE